LVLDQATVKLMGGNSRVFNFEKYVFKPSYDQIMNHPDTPMLAADYIELGTNAHLSIEGILGGSADLMGEFTLMENTNGYSEAITGDFVNIDDTFILQQGLSKTYTVKAEMKYVSLIATITSPPITSRQASVPAEAQIASASLLNEASNFVSGAGITNALVATRTVNATANNFNASQQNLGGQNLSGQNLVAQNFAIPRQNADYTNSKWTSFSAVSAGSSRYKSGASVDIDSFSLLSGLARGFAMSKGDVLYGAFAEYGRADLDTHNSFTSQSDIRGTGDSTYWGGGIIGRFDHNSGTYVDASFRMGSASTNHSSSDYQGFVGQNISYDTNSLYLSTHLALGYNWQVFGSGNIDTYGKYFWAHSSGDDATIAGDAYKFSAINSHRLRFGARYTHAINKYVSPYLGASYEHEFDSYVSSSVQGLTFDAPNLKGDTGIFELGISVNPLANIPMTIDLNTEIFTGMREGYLVNAQLVFDF